MAHTYVHGYDPREHVRLKDQADALVELLHHDTGFPAGTLVLEAGCGVGAQTVTLASRSPGARIVSGDISWASLRSAREATQRARHEVVAFLQFDIHHPPFPPKSFDHLFLCFVLEHLAHPGDALRSLLQLVKPGGTVTAIEGDHGSTYFHPDSQTAHQAIQSLVDLQARAGGNACIGRQLYPLFTEVGLTEVSVSPRMVYADASRPALVDGFIKKTFTAMVEGVRGDAIGAELMDADSFDKGIRDLYRTAERDGVFCYTFFKARAITPAM